MCKVSIISINYNNKEGLSKTFDSVKNQEWKDFEYIVIDGGSTDGSVDLIKQNKQISIWVSEKDKGVYSAMNKAIRVSKGEYLIFMNSGDFFYDNFVLQNIVPFLEKNISILYGDAIYFNDKGYKSENKYPDKLSFSHFYNSGLNHQATFIKRELFGKYFLYNEDFKISSDWEFFIYTICKKNEPYLHLNQFICYYDYSGMSSNPENSILHKHEREEIISKWFPLFVDDYKLTISELKNKRVQNILHIKKHKTAWKILKGVSNVLLFFLSKKST